MSKINDLLVLIELHDVDGLRSCFAAGANPNQEYNGLPLIYELLGEYTRSARFKECVQVFVEFGLHLNDPLLLAVLLDDAAELDQQLTDNPGVLQKTYSFKCAYTPVVNATLLHICAEYNHVQAAKVLVAHGLSVNSAAGFDEFGFGGQSPVFHTVNQNNHQSEGMLRFLLDHKADILYPVKGLIWGRGYEWETFIPSVNPISYCMMGLLPQMHRNEQTIAATVQLLIRHAYGIEYKPGNIPNQYLRH